MWSSSLQNQFHRHLTRLSASPRPPNWATHPAVLNWNKAKARKERTVVKGTRAVFLEPWKSLPAWGAKQMPAVIIYCHEYSSPAASKREQLCGQKRACPLQGALVHWPQHLGQPKKKSTPCPRPLELIKMDASGQLYFKSKKFCFCFLVFKPTHRCQMPLRCTLCPWHIRSPWVEVAVLAKGEQTFALISKIDANLRVKLWFSQRFVKDTLLWQSKVWEDLVAKHIGMFILITIGALLECCHCCGSVVRVDKLIALPRNGADVWGFVPCTTKSIWEKWSHSLLHMVHK